MMVDGKKKVGNCGLLKKGFKLCHQITSPDYEFLFYNVIVWPNYRCIPPINKL